MPVKQPAGSGHLAPWLAGLGSVGIRIALPRQFVVHDSVAGGGRPSHRGNSNAHLTKTCYAPPPCAPPPAGCLTWAIL
ncbi:MAG: hypothetical protein WA118_09110 [Carboxydocellales bacterium]